jgi:hypothetical protein
VCFCFHLSSCFHLIFDADLLLLIARTMYSSLAWCVLQSNLENGLASLEVKVKKLDEMYSFCVQLLLKEKIEMKNEYSHPITPLKSYTT